MAAALVESVIDSTAVAALRRALRYTIGTAIVALIASNLFPEADAERLSTTAYLAVIFAAVTLTALHVASGGATAERKRSLVVTFPTALLSVVLVTLLLLVGAALAGQPGAEAFVLLVCAAFTAFAALSGAALFRALHVGLAAGGAPAALTRYAVLAGIVALVLATILPAEMKDVVVEGGCWAVVAAAVFLSVSLTRRTSLWKFVMVTFKGGPTRFFEQTIRYAAYACAGALVAAAMWQQNGDTLAFSAYVAIVIATVGIAVDSRVTLAAASRRGTSISNPR
ncbi:MAG TPA: hypothetical protein VKR56_14725 [Candidatus Cybelea sp.]|nr:hypothetical protein [Candidatus Cybelea sp.]